MIDLNRELSPKPKCVPCPIIVGVGLLSMLIMYGWVSAIVQKVFNGAGLEHCCTIEGVRFNYVSVLVLLCAIAVALIVAAILQARDWFIRRDFERRYGVKLHPLTSRPTDSSGSSSTSSFHGAEYGDGD